MSYSQVPWHFTDISISIVKQQHRQQLGGTVLAASACCSVQASADLSQSHRVAPWTSSACRPATVSGPSQQCLAYRGRPEDEAEHRSTSVSLDDATYCDLLLSWHHVYSAWRNYFNYLFKRKH